MCALSWVGYLVVGVQQGPNTRQHVGLERLQHLDVVMPLEWHAIANQIKVAVGEVMILQHLQAELMCVDVWDLSEVEEMLFRTEENRRMEYQIFYMERDIHQRPHAERHRFVQLIKSRHLYP